MKQVLIVSILLCFWQGKVFAQGKYLVAKTLVSKYDSLTNKWTPEAPVSLLENCDGVVAFYKDSICYNVTGRKAKSAKSTTGWQYTHPPYTMAIKLLAFQKPPEDSCYINHTASAVENGQRRGDDYFALVKNARVPAEVKLITCTSIMDFNNSVAKSGILRITMQQAPQNNEPFSKWQLILEFYRLPQTK